MPTPDQQLRTAANANRVPPLRKFDRARFTREPARHVLTPAQIQAIRQQTGTLDAGTAFPVGGATSVQVHNPPNPADGAGYANYDHLPLFPQTISIHDVAQGQLADCYYLAPLAAIAFFRPDLLPTLIVKESPNVYRCRFWRSGIDHWVYVNADLPTGGVRNVDGCIWVALYEKAYAFFRTYNVTTKASANTYASLAIGWTGSAFSDLGFPSTMYSAGSAGWAAAATAIAKNQPVALITGATIPVGVPLIGNHADAVTAVLLASAVLQNPWGFDGAGTDSDPNDGTVTIPIPGGNAAIAGISVCTGFTPPLQPPTPVIVTPAPTPTPTPTENPMPTAKITKVDHTTAGFWDGIRVDFTATGGTPIVTVTPTPPAPVTTNAPGAFATFPMPAADCTITLTVTAPDGTTATDTAVVRFNNVTPSPLPTPLATTNPVVGFRWLRKDGSMDAAILIPNP